MFAVPHSYFLILMALLSPKQLWHFLMEQEHNTDPPLITSWVNPAALIHMGLLCSPHHHRDAALNIFTKTHRDGTCELPVGKSRAQPQPILSPFPMSSTVDNSAAKEGKRRHQSPVTKHILHFQALKDMNNKHKDILCSICIASTGVWKLQTSFERVLRQKEATQLKAVLFFSGEAMKRQHLPFCCHFEVCLLVTLKGRKLPQKRRGRKRRMTAWSPQNTSIPDKCSFYRNQY